MAVTTLRAMLNTEPHHFEATFDKPYEHITVNDILVKAATFIDIYATQHSFRHQIPHQMRPRLSLRYLKKEDAFLPRPGITPGSPLSEQAPSPYSELATIWYRNTGYNLSSDAVEAHSLLSSTAPFSDTTDIRWYVLLSVPLNPTSSFVPTGYTYASDLDKAREEYMDSVTMSFEEKNNTKNRTPVPARSDFGPSAMLHIPIFAEAFNMLAHPETVALERGTREGGFDIYRTACQFISAANQDFDDEKGFSRNIFTILKDLLDFLPELLLHHSINDKNNIPAAELDWVGFCKTAHGMLCVPFSGRSKHHSVKGDSVVAQSFLALQRLLVVRPKLRDFLKLTSCPSVVLALDGINLQVWVMHFGTDFCGAQLFGVLLRQNYAARKLHGIAVKLQIVRNTVRKLCEFYASLHGATKPPTLPFLFPQPLSLLQRLKPIPASPEVVHSLSDLNLHIIEIADTTNILCALYRGFIEHPLVLPVYVRIIQGKYYGLAAHQLLAEQNPPLAPKLFWCGEIMACHFMVVMEQLEGQDHQDRHPRKCNEEDAAIVRRDIGRAVDTLHKHGLVHGDIRQSNIVIVHGHGYLINFDSAGAEGVATYPPSLDPETTWPDDAFNLMAMPISREDDKFRLKRTIEELLGNA